MSENPQLAAFLTVAETGTISATAKKLNLSQAGATQRIQALEASLGVSLFTRGRKGMKLTAEGHSLLRYCAQVKSLEGRLLASLKKGGEEEEVSLTLVAPAAFTAGRFASQCAGIFRAWPKLNLRFLVDVNANRLNLLKSGQADIAVVLPHEVTPELDSKLLRPLEYQLVCSPAWKGRPLREILEQERLYAYHPDEDLGIRYLREFGLLESLKKPRLYANENQTLQNLITLGVGFGLLPKELAATPIREGALVALNQERSLKVAFAAAWYPRAQMPNYFSDVVKAIK